MIALLGGRTGQGLGVWRRHSVDGLVGGKSTGAASVRNATAARTAAASTAASTAASEGADVPQGPARERYWWHREEHAHHTCC